MAAATKRSRGRAASPSPEKTARAGEGKATAVKGRPTPPQSSKWNNVLGAGALFVAMGLFALVCANAAIQTEGAGAQAAAGGARQEWGSIAEIQEGIIAAAREQRFDEVGRLAVKGKQLREYEQVASEVLTEDSPLRGYSAKQRAQLDAFFSSLTMILVSELGDKTFFIAAVMAMKHPRAVVLAGALGALALMTVLSAAAGFALPNLIPREYTHSASVLLFLVFGLKLLKDAREMERSGPSEELEEVEMSLNKGNSKKDPDSKDVESGDKSQGGMGSTFLKSVGGVVAWQAFTLTFLAEWGDRSQIATIALAAHKDPFAVTLGGVIGHAVCTTMAVVGGRMLAARISERTVAVCGGSLFLLFAVHGAWQGGSSLHND